MTSESSYNDYFIGTVASQKNCWVSIDNGPSFPCSEIRQKTMELEDGSHGLRFTTPARASSEATGSSRVCGASVPCGSTSTVDLGSHTQTYSPVLRSSSHLSSDADYLGLYVFLAVAACMFIGRWIRS